MATQDSSSSDKLAGQPYYRGRQVLVAGAAGFLGSECVRQLEQLGATITAVARNWHETTEVPATPAVQRLTGDLADLTFVAKAVDKAEVIFDFVGTGGVTNDQCSPAAHYQAECLPHLHLMQACARLPKKPIYVFCSTRLVYGKTQRLPVNECHPTRPESVYAIHKLLVEDYLRYYRRTSDMVPVIFRLSNPYGPVSPNGRHSGVINQFVERALQKQPITIYGEGAQQRDYIHVADAVSMMITAAATPACQLGETFNLGSGRGISLRDAVRLITEIAGSPQAIHTPWPGEQAALETGDYVTDLSKLRGAMAFTTPRDYETGIRQVVSAAAAQWDD